MNMMREMLCLHRTMKRTACSVAELQSAVKYVEKFMYEVSN